MVNKMNLESMILIREERERKGNIKYMTPEESRILTKEARLRGAAYGSIQHKSRRYC